MTRTECEHIDKQREQDGEGIVHVGATIFTAVALWRLNPPTWICDATIACVIEIAKTLDHHSHTFFLNTFFANQLRKDYGPTVVTTTPLFPNARRFFLKYNAQVHRIIHFPVHDLRGHWYSISVDVFSTPRRFTISDSLTGCVDHHDLYLLVTQINEFISWRLKLTPSEAKRRSAPLGGGTAPHFSQIDSDCDIVFLSESDTDTAVQHLPLFNEYLFGTKPNHHRLRPINCTGVSGRLRITRLFKPSNHHVDQDDVEDLHLGSLEDPYIDIDNNALVGADTALMRRLEPQVDIEPFEELDRLFAAAEVDEHACWSAMTAELQRTPHYDRVTYGSKANERFLDMQLNGVFLFPVLRARAAANAQIHQARVEAPPPRSVVRKRTPLLRVGDIIAFLAPPGELGQDPENDDSDKSEDDDSKRWAPVIHDEEFTYLPRFAVATILAITLDGRGSSFDVRCTGRWSGQFRLDRTVAPGWISAVEVLRPSNLDQVEYDRRWSTNEFDRRWTGKSPGPFWLDQYDIRGGSFVPDIDAETAALLGRQRHMAVIFYQRVSDWTLHFNCEDAEPLSPPDNILPPDVDSVRVLLPDGNTDPACACRIVCVCTAPTVQQVLPVQDPLSSDTNSDVSSEVFDFPDDDMADYSPDLGDQQQSSKALARSLSGTKKDIRDPADEAALILGPEGPAPRTDDKDPAFIAHCVIDPHGPPPAMVGRHIAAVPLDIKTIDEYEDQIYEGLIAMEDFRSAEATKKRTQAKAVERRLEKQSPRKYAAAKPSPSRRKKVKVILETEDYFGRVKTDETYARWVVKRLTGGSPSTVSWIACVTCRFFIGSSWSQTNM